MYLHMCRVVKESCKETILEVHHAYSLSQYVTCQLPTSAAANIHTHAQTKACLVVNWKSGKVHCGSCTGRFYTCTNPICMLCCHTVYSPSRMKFPVFWSLTYLVFTNINFDTNIGITKSIRSGI